MPTTPRSATMSFFARGLLMALLAGVTASCASSSRVMLTIHESPTAAVRVVEVADPRFEAAHPVSLAPAVIGRALKGVVVRDEPSTLETMFSSEPQVRRAFSNEDADELAPYIAKALEKASPRQRVEFEVMHPADPRSVVKRAGAGTGSSQPSPSNLLKEITAGALYVHGLSLHVALTKFRAIPEAPDMIHGPNRQYPDPSGMDEREVLFTPEAALRPDTYRGSGLLGQGATPELVIDYELLAKLPPPKAGPTGQAGKPAGEASQAAGSAPATAPASAGAGQTAPSSPDLQSVNEQRTRKDQELEALKEEVDALKRRLDEQEAQRATKPSKRKNN